jgi:hypothetical protein
MIKAMIAGNNEKSAQIIERTDYSSVMVLTVWPVASSVPEMKPEMPRKSATNDPLRAVPNFCAMVPLEKIIPVEETPFFSVA